MNNSCLAGAENFDDLTKLYTSYANEAGEQPRPITADEILKAVHDGNEQGMGSLLKDIFQ